MDVFCMHFVLICCTHTFFNVSLNTLPRSLRAMVSLKTYRIFFFVSIKFNLLVNKTNVNTSIFPKSNFFYTSFIIEVMSIPYKLKKTDTKDAHQVQTRMCFFHINKKKLKLAKKKLSKLLRLSQDIQQKAAS